ncbi:MAG: outer membrane beta-barrel protein [Flavobacteriales bacterium]
MSLLLTGYGQNSSNDSASIDLSPLTGEGTKGFGGEMARRLAIGISLVPSWNKVLYIRDGSGNPVFGSFENTEIPFASLQGGVDVLYKLNNRWSFYSGLHHMTGGMNTKEYYFYPMAPDPFIPEKVMYSYRYRYFQIPLEAKAYLCKGFYIQAGIGFNFFYGAYSYALQTYSDGRVVRTKHMDVSTIFRQVVLTYNMCVGYTFNRHGKWNYSVSAFSSVGLMGVSNFASLNRRLLSLGLNFSVSRNL